MKAQAPNREHCLCAIEKRDSFLAEEGEGRQSGVLETFGAGQDFSFVFGTALPDQDKCHVGKGCQVAACANAATGGDDRSNAVVQQIADSFGYYRTNSR
jgi:hypothetical protein